MLWDTMEVKPWDASTWSLQHAAMFSLGMLAAFGAPFVFRPGLV
jgi:hypothetical protein